MDNVTRHNLNSLMEFDHVIEVHADGTVTEPDTIWAPEVWIQNNDPRNPVISSRDGWELMNGYSGQFTYRGPIMHESEYIGGKMADDILAEPGVYVAVVVSDSDAEDDDRDAGWAVAKLIRRPSVPADFPVKVLADSDSAKSRATCGKCGRSWDDSVITSYTPTPSARCPFELFH